MKKITILIAMMGIVFSWSTSQVKAQALVEENPNHEVTQAAAQTNFIMVSLWGSYWRATGMWATDCRIKVDFTVRYPNSINFKNLTVYIEANNIISPETVYEDDYWLQPTATVNNVTPMGPTNQIFVW